MDTEKTFNSNVEASKATAVSTFRGYFSRPFRRQEPYGLPPSASPRTRTPQRHVGTVGEYNAPRGKGQKSEAVEERTAAGAAYRSPVVRELNGPKVRLNLSRTQFRGCKTFGSRSGEKEGLLAATYLWKKIDNSTPPSCACSVSAT